MPQKALILNILILVMAFQIAAQPINVELRIKGCTQRSFWVTFDNDGILSTDTFKIKREGVYVLSTTRLLKPQIVQLVSDETTLDHVFLAPGYDLLITGDIANEIWGIIPNRYLAFKGKGRQANSYECLLDSIVTSRSLMVDRYSSDRKKKLWSIDAISKLKDSLINNIFYHDTNNDHSLPYFGSIKKVDNRYERLTDLIIFGRGGSDSLRRRSLLYDTGGFSDSEIQDDSLLISPSFRNFITTDYLRYLNDLYPSAGQSILASHRNFDLVKTADERYTGRVRQYAIRYLLRIYMLVLDNEKDLLNSEDTLKAWIMRLEANTDRSDLLRLLEGRKDEFGKFTNGKPLPLFRGIDINGKQHSISEYANKVIYIDLWATWCGPCRAENPHLTTLERMYKDSGLVVLSIAVLDHTIPWKDYLRSEKPAWTQWFDAEGKTGNLFGTLLLPRFMIVSRKGIIISADAPKPSEIDQLRPLLNATLKEH